MATISGNIDFSDYLALSDIGYKHYTMPEGLSPKEYLDYIKERHYRWEHEEDGIKLSRFYRFYDPNYCGNDRGFRFTKEEFRYMRNEFIRVDPLIDLSFIPVSEWRENEYALIQSVISDVDFYSSYDLYRKITEQTNAVSKLFEDLFYQY